MEVLCTKTVRKNFWARGKGRVWGVWLVENTGVFSDGKMEYLGIIITKSLKGAIGNILEHRP